MYATKNVSSCFFSNSNTTNDATFTYSGTEYTVPAWSVSILPDCKKEVYNTAKVMKMMIKYVYNLIRFKHKYLPMCFIFQVNAQTSVMVKKNEGVEKTGNSLKWSWRPEMIYDSSVRGKGQVSANRIIDQKMINDRSDYLWYMNR